MPSFPPPSPSFPRKRESSPRPWTPAFAGVTWRAGGRSPTTRRLVERREQALGTIGSEALLHTRKLALLCSRACPGSIIVQTLDVVRALRAEVDEAAWAALYSTVSRPFEKPATGKIAIKVINHYGDEVLKVYEVE